MSCFDDENVNLGSRLPTGSEVTFEKTVLMNPVSQLSGDQLIQLKKAQTMKNHLYGFIRKPGRRDPNYFTSHSDVITHAKSQVNHMKPSRSCVTQSYKIVAPKRTPANCYQFNNQIWYYNIYKHKLDCNPLCK